MMGDFMSNNPKQIFPKCECTFKRGDAVLQTHTHTQSETIYYLVSKP